MSPYLERLRAWYGAYERGWQRQSVRMQIMGVCGVPMVVLAVWLSVVLGPATTHIQELQTRLTQAKAQQLALVSTTSAAQQVQQGALARVAEVQRQIDDAQQALAALQTQTVPPDAMRARLAQLVARSGHAQWVGLESAPVIVLPRATLFRHPMRVQLEGDFEALLAAVRAIEEQAQTLHWRALELEVQTYPVLRAHLDLYTLSDQKIWLRL